MERLSIHPSLLQIMHFDNQKWSSNRGFAAAGQPLGRMERCCCLLPACGLLGPSPSPWQSCPAIAISSACGRRRLKLPPGWKWELERFPSSSLVQCGVGWAGASGADGHGTKAVLQRAPWCSGCCIVPPRGHSSPAWVKQCASVGEGGPCFTDPKQSEPCAQQGGGLCSTRGGLWSPRGPRGSHTMPLQPTLWARCVRKSLASSNHICGSLVGWRQELQITARAWYLGNSFSWVFL